MKPVRFRLLLNVSILYLFIAVSQVFSEGIPYPSFNVEYPTLSGRLALTGIRVNKDYNYIRIVDVSEPVSKDIAYIQCKDPVFFNQPVLIGKNDSVWQFKQNTDSLEIVIHKNGDSSTENIHFSGSVSIEKTDIIADDEVNYLVVFLKKEDRLESIKFIHVDSGTIRVMDWNLFTDCAICKHGDWRMSTRWIKLTSHKSGPVIVWCDFKEPPKFDSLIVKVSQLINSNWTLPVVLDHEGADTKPDICANGDDLIVTWLNGSHTLNAARIQSLGGIKEMWSATNLKDERAESNFLKDVHAITLDEDLYIFYSFICYANDMIHLNVRRFEHGSWQLLGTINQTEKTLPFYPFLSDGDVSVIFKSDEGIYKKTLKGDKWTQTDQMKPSQCYLKTLGRCVTIGNFSVDRKLHIPPL